jgi:hypothetical protein
MLCEGRNALVSEAGAGCCEAGSLPDNEVGFSTVISKSFLCGEFFILWKLSIYCQFTARRMPLDKWWFSV